MKRHRTFLASIVVPVTLLLAGCADAGPTDAPDPGVEAGAPDAYIGAVTAALRNATEQTPADIELPARCVSTANEPRFMPREDFEARLVPSTVYGPLDTWVEIDGNQTAPPSLVAAEGVLTSDADSEVRVTVTDSWIHGVILENRNLCFVLVGAVPADGEPVYWSESSDGFAPHAGLARPSLDPTTARRIPGDCMLGLRDVQVSPVVGITGGHYEGPVRVLNLIADSDVHFADRYGDDAFPLMVAFVHEADAVLEYEIGVRLHLVGLHQHTDPAFNDGSAISPTDPAEAYWNDRPDLNRDLVHLFGYGGPRGIANCVGSAGDPSVAYTYSNYRLADHNVNRNVLVLVHEIGHSLSAHHHHGNTVEAETGATLMIQGMAAGYAPAFSTASKSLMRGWAEAYLAPAA